MIGNISSIHTQNSKKDWWTGIPSFSKSKPYLYAAKKIEPVVSSLSSMKGRITKEISRARVAKAAALALLAVGSYYVYTNWERPLITDLKLPAFPQEDAITDLKLPAFPQEDAITDLKLPAFPQENVRNIRSIFYQALASSTLSLPMTLPLFASSKNQCARNSFHPPPSSSLEVVQKSNKNEVSKKEASTSDTYSDTKQLVEVVEENQTLPLNIKKSDFSKDRDTSNQEVRREILQRFTHMYPAPEEDSENTSPFIPLKARETLNLDKFMHYCRKFQVTYDHNLAWKDTNQGIDLYQRISKGERIESTKENLRKICWALMAYKNDQGISFENGTFVLKDPDYRIFETFARCPDVYGRASSHFKKRALLTTVGSWKNYSHFGIDINHLPPNMGAILMGRIQAKNGEETTYLKFEDWGADMCIKNPNKARHFLCHSFGFLASQYKRAMGTNQTSEDRKEHMSPEHIKKIKTLVEKVKPLIPEEKEPDLKEWGFSEAVPYLLKAVQNPTIDEAIANEIYEYIETLEQKFGESLSTQKGEEVQIGSSMLNIGFLKQPEEVDDWVFVEQNI